MYDRFTQGLLALAWLWPNPVILRVDPCHAVGVKQPFDAES